MNTKINLWQKMRLFGPSVFSDTYRLRAQLVEVI